MQVVCHNKKLPTHAAYGQEVFLYFIDFTANFKISIDKLR